MTYTITGVEDPIIVNAVVIVTEDEAVVVADVYKMVPQNLRARVAEEFLRTYILTTLSRSSNFKRRSNGSS
jgi:hypothetical protein